MSKLRAKWDALTGEQRTKLVRGGVVAGIVLLVFGSYYLSGRSEQHKEEKAHAKEEKAHAVRLGDNLIEDDLRAGTRKMREDINTKLDTQSKNTEDLQKTVKGLAEVVNAIKSTEVDGQLPKAASQAPNGLPTGVLVVESKFKYPPPPPASANGAVRPATASAARPVEEAQPIYIGDIEHASGAKEVEKKEIKKKKTIYLPAGFMDAMLLTGLKAATVQNAKDNPEPMMFRVQAPAVLPNEIKANLKGCFVFANGIGRLDAERVDARLVSLHCLAQDGQSVIEEQIKGYVADKSDGSKGLSGRPVTKAGANMVRAFIAGVFGGVGNATRANNTTLSISPLGATSAQTSGDQVLRAGVGEGISEAAADMRKVFLDLVKQAAPVIEVGPTKECTIVLTEGVNLEIRDYDNAGDTHVAAHK